jgi:branched-chain amino acid transport system ATP-binding protein
MTVDDGDLLRLTDVSVEFRGFQALRNVSVSVREGEWLGVIGPNGSGKTTLMNVIMGVYPASTGTIIFRGDDITSAPPLAPARRGIVRSFQHDQLAASLTLTENVALGLHGHTPRVRGRSWFGREKRALAIAREALIEIGCAGYTDLLPREIPQGVRRFAEITRALLNQNVGMLLLDEPAAGLSASERDRLQKVLKQLRTTRPSLAVVLIEHDVKFVADQATRLIALDAGTKIGDGPTDDVLHSDAVGVAFLGGASGARN